MIRRRFLQVTIPFITTSILLFAVFSLFASSGAAEEVVNNLTIDVEIGPDGQSQNANRGETITYTYAVTNTGTSTLTYLMTADNDLGWTTLLSPQVITLSAQISGSVMLSINVNTNSLAGPVNSTITVTSKISDTVSDSATNTTTVKKVKGVEVSAGETKEGFPNETVTYTHSVTNTGNVSDTYMNAATPTKPAFSVETSPTEIEIDAYQAKTLIISVTIPGDALFGDSSTTAITVTSKTDGSVFATAEDSTDVGLVVDVILEKDEDGSASPGATVEYTHILTNTGNDIDAFDITALSDKGYSVTPTPDVVQNLSAGGSEEIKIAISIPAGVSPGVVDGTTVTATSRADNSENDIVVDTTTIGQVYDVEIVKDERSTALPGATVVYENTVTNKGTGDDNFDITVSSDQGYVVTRVPAFLNLGAGQSKIVKVSIEIPAGETAGTVDETTVTATSRGTGNPFDDVVDTTTVAEVLSVDIKKNESGSADPGATAVYTNTVINLGNGTEKFNLSASSNQGFVTRVAPSSLTLNKGANGLVRVEIDIPASAGSDIVDKTTVTVASDTDANVKDSVIDKTTINKHRLFIPLVRTSTEWNQVGASSWASGDAAAATSVDVCPSDSDLIFAGTKDALRLFDGNSWNTITGDVPKGGDISSIVMKSTCDTVYVVVFRGSQDPLIDAHGVWEGAFSDQGNWTWQELTGGVDVTLARKAVISDGTLFAAGGFGIAYWEDDAWIAANGVVATSSEPIMDLSVADGVKNEGPIYAVKWLSKIVYRNTNPGSTPGDWAPIPGLDDVPDNGLVRSVAGDESNVRYVGTTENLYGLTGKSWGLVKDQESRTVLISGNIYAGFAGAPGDGVYISTDQGASFSPYNEGWKPPQTVFSLVANPDYLFAATSAGVSKR